MELNKKNMKAVFLTYDPPLIREELCDFFNKTDRQIRNAIHELRKQGCPIAQHPDGGYVWDRKLFKKTMEDLRKRAISMLSVLPAYERRKFNKQYELLFKKQNYALLDEVDNPYHNIPEAK